MKGGPPADGGDNWLRRGAPWTSSACSSKQCSDCKGDLVRAVEVLHLKAKGQATAAAVCIVHLDSTKELHFGEDLAGQLVGREPAALLGQHLARVVAARGSARSPS